MLILASLLPGGPTYTTFREGGLHSEGPTFLKAMTNYTVRVGSDVTFTCQVENITSYKVSKQPKANLFISRYFSVLPCY